MVITLWPLANSSISTHGTFQFYTLKFPELAILLLASEIAHPISPFPGLPHPLPQQPYGANSFRIQLICMSLSVPSLTLHLYLITVFIILCYDSPFPFLPICIRGHLRTGLFYLLLSPQFIWPCLIYSRYSISCLLNEWMRWWVKNQSRKMV